MTAVTYQEISGFMKRYGFHLGVPDQVDTDVIMQLWCENKIPSEELITASPALQDNLGSYYWIIKRDPETAKRYYQMALDAGYHIAAYHCGNCYQRIEKDQERGIEYHLQGAALGVKECMNEIGNYYLNIKKDPQTAKKYFQMSADKNDGSAWNNLGYHYSNVENNLEKAVECYEKAVALKSIAAMGNLADYYHFVVRDPERAEKYYLMAIDDDYDDCPILTAIICRLARLYRTDKPDPSACEKYYRLAAARGSEKALTNVGVCLQVFKNDNIAAFVCYQRARAAGCKVAEDNLVALRENRQGTWAE